MYLDVYTCIYRIMTFCGSIVIDCDSIRSYRFNYHLADWEPALLRESQDDVDGGGDSLLYDIT